MSQKLYAERTAAADEEFEHYVFKDITVGEVDGWESEAPGNDFRRAVYFEDPEHPEADSVKGSFCAIFASNDSAEIVDAYATYEGEDVGYRDPEIVLAAAGFEKYSVGGGMPAWRKNLDDGTYLLLTMDERPSDWIASRFDSSEGFVTVTTSFFVGPAMSVAKSLPSPEELGGVGTQHEFNTEAEVEAAVSVAKPASI